MRKSFLLLASIMMLSLIGCSKDEVSKFDYDINLIVGKWRVTHIPNKDGSYLDVTTHIAESVFKPTYITFTADGKYSGVGQFGEGKGTYKTKGKVITTYLDGVEKYLSFEIISLSNTNCEAKIFDDSLPEGFTVKCRKE